LTVQAQEAMLPYAPGTWACLRIRHARRFAGDRRPHQTWQKSDVL